MRDIAVFDFIAQLLRKQFRFYVVIISIAIAGIVYANGWSWASAVVILIAALMIPFAFALVSFWVSAFRDIGRRGDTH